jgi:hypothetical protein
MNIVSDRLRCCGGPTNCWGHQEMRLFSRVCVFARLAAAHGSRRALAHPARSREACSTRTQATIERV